MDNGESIGRRGFSSEVRERGDGEGRIVRSHGPTLDRVKEAQIPPFQSQAWPRSSFYLQKGLNGKAVSDGRSGFSDPVAYALRTLALLPHPTPTFQRKGVGGRRL